jgi:phytanoyl-CoA hydroxylase
MQQMRGTCAASAPSGGVPSEREALPVSDFAADGFLVIPDFAGPAAIAALRERAEAIVAAFDPHEARTIFSTADNGHAKDAYFLGSSDKIRCFFEAEAFDEAGELRVPKDRAINKLGHAMHDLDPVFERFSRDPRLREIALHCGITAPHLYQSMYIFKQPHIGGEVRWHQDGTYLVTDPQTVTGFWWALEDADRDNGCLWVQPGGHKTPLRETFVVDEAGPRTIVQSDLPWPSLDDAIPVEVKAGTLVVLHGSLPHYSAPNRSAHSRHAYTLHVVDARATYAATNWLQRPAAFPARDFSLN